MREGGVAVSLMGCTRLRRGGQSVEVPCFFCSSSSRWHAADVFARSSNGENDGGGELLPTGKKGKEESSSRAVMSLLSLSWWSK